MVRWVTIHPVLNQWLTWCVSRMKRNPFTQVLISHSEGFCQGCSGEWSWHSLHPFGPLAGQVNAKTYACQSDHISSALVSLSWWPEEYYMVGVGVREGWQIRRPWLVPELFAEHENHVYHPGSNSHQSQPSWALQLHYKHALCPNTFKVQMEQAVVQKKCQISLLKILNLFFPQSSV